MFRKSFSNKVLLTHFTSLILLFFFLVFSRFKFSVKDLVRIVKWVFETNSESKTDVEEFPFP